MEYGLLPTIASLAFVVILSLVYFYKKRTPNILNKTFKLFVIEVLLFGIIQMLYTLSLKYIDIYIINFIAWKLFWIVGLLAIESLSLLLFLIIKKINVESYKELFNNKKEKLLMIVYIVIVILFALLPPYNITEIKNSNIVYNIKIYSVYQSIVILSFIVFHLVLYFKNKNNADSKYNKTVIFTVILGLILTILQIMYNETSFYVPYLCICTYIIYFTYANPDIELINEIYTAQSDIEKSSKTKSDFLSNMTYELKMPLNVISSTCDSIIHSEKYSEEEVKEELKQIVSSSNTLVDIVTNVVNISKIESSKASLNEKKYSLREMVSDLNEIAASKIGSKNLKLVIELDETLPSELYGDVSKLSQSLSNLLINAINYTDVGKVTFSITGKNNSDQETLLFKVSDTGSGIKDEDKPKVFQKGIRFENSVENEIEGSGFGLSIAKDNIDSMGGKIWFKSEYRVGSSFFIEVTQKITDSTSLKDTVKKVDDSNTILDCSNYKLLIVDDNKPNIKVLQKILEKYKFQIDTVTSGKECIYKIKSEEKYNIIFLDHFMPEMDGIETIKILKNLEGYTLPPIICISANALPGMREMYLKNGFSDYISKPVNIKELDKLIKKYFNKK